jgi:hypothetical protein
MLRLSALLFYLGCVAALCAFDVQYVPRLERGLETARRRLREKCE